jgi:putative addiction module component (TIGR02574 family)
MSDFHSVLPPESEPPFSDDWQREIERRVAELDAGTATTVPWDTVWEEALAHIAHGKGN